MRHRRVRRLPPRGEGTSKNKDRERRTNDYNHNPVELHLDPPGWVSFQTLPWVKFRPLLTVIDGYPDPCVRYCTLVHEWYHHTDTRPFRGSDLLNDSFFERGAYRWGAQCLRTFL